MKAKNAWGDPKWRLSRLLSLIRFALIGKIFQDRGGHPEHSILVAGSARSGTTWLADIVASQTRSRLMFEPFHAEKVPEFGRFHYFQYMRPGEPNPALEAFSAKIFSGRIRHPWIDRRVDYLFPKFRIVKEIRANLFLKWLVDAFPQVPHLFIVRHPCAVVLSRMRLEWATDADIEPFFKQPKLLEDFLADHMGVIENARTPEEKHAIIWCITNLVPLGQFGLGNLNVVFYEDLVRCPEMALEKVFKFLGRNYDRKSALNRMAKPSATAAWNRAGQDASARLGDWKNSLSEAQIKNILGIVRRFGMDQYYDDKLMPLQSG